MKKPTLTLLALLALTLAGCGKHKIDKGVVVDKSMAPERTVVQYNAALKMPITMLRPASYCITVRDSGIIESFKVDETSYNAVSIGDSIWFNDPDCPCMEKGGENND